MRIDLRGEGLINSKSEYNRCRVPRLKGWKAEQNDKDSSSQEGEQDKRDREAEESLQERDNKRKNPDMPRSKRRKLELLNNCGNKGCILEQGLT